MTLFIWTHGHQLVKHTILLITLTQKISDMVNFKTWVATKHGIVLTATTRTRAKSHLEELAQPGIFEN